LNFLTSPDILFIPVGKQLKILIPEWYAPFYTLVKCAKGRYRSEQGLVLIECTTEFSNINVHKFCKEKDLEACVVKLYLPNCTIGIVNTYRSPSGNYEHILNNLETLLNSISSNSMELIICGNFNINFLNNTTQKQLLNSLLATCGLYSTVQFSTRICNNSISTINNIFINIVKYNNFIVYPFVNGMSDHDAQIIVLHDITLPNNNNYFHFTRNFRLRLKL